MLPCFHVFMTEADPESDKQVLVAILESDSSPQVGASTNSVLGRFVATTRPAEDVAERLASDENVELGLRVERTLGATAITASFKSYIINEVRQAHGWRNPVSETVSPDRLGLRSGDGIYDPEQSQDIESHAIRGFLHDTMKAQIVIPEDAEGEELGPAIRNPRVWAETVQWLAFWEDDYKATYGEDAFAFAGEGKSIFFEAAQRVDVDSRGEWSELAKRAEADRRKQNE
jgi:hypothetical protein